MMTKLFQNSITDIPGILVGHAQNYQALTGCTVILVKKGAVGGMDQRGGAPGTRETDLLRPMHMVEKVHGILLAGGSAFGLDAASGVMRYLEEKGVGVNTGTIRVPIVPAAILYDLAIGDPKIRPDAAMGYQACLQASSAKPAEGNAGAGMGATAGKILGPHQVTKSGIGTASIEIGNGVIVGAIVAVNPFGDVLDPSTGKIIAGARPIQKGPIHIGGQESFIDTLEFIRTFTGRTIMTLASLSNTVIGVVATNARLNKEETNKVAQMAQDGLAKAIRPAHTMMDGDTIFALATGAKIADVSVVGAYAAEIFTQAILNGVRAAESVAGLPCARDLVLGNGI
jgi:L-aminopeptidase/D-esterase-like protein